MTGEESSTARQVAHINELRQKIMGFIVSQAIHAACTLGVVDELAVAPARGPELAAKLGVDSDALSRLLRVLVAERIFTEDELGRFAPTELGQLLRGDRPGSLRYFSELMSGEAYHVWGAAHYSIQTGKAAFEMEFGAPYFDWLENHPAESAKFHRAQGALVGLRLAPLLARPWGEVATVVDIGGGNGSLLAALLPHHPHLQGVLFDTPQVVPDAQTHLAELGLTARVRCVGGDFFAEVPAAGDVYVLSHILHDWSDDRALTILARCREAMPEHARLLLVEHVIPDDVEPHPAKLLDLHMLVLLGGRERSESAWRALLARSGFGLDRVTPGPGASLLCARPTRPT